MQPVQPINVKLLVVKYIINVILFTAIYVLISYLLLYLNVTGFTANVITIIVSGFGMIYLMRKIGPWFDEKFSKK
jgi:hypothetical protein